ncbi:hypothetical protein BJV82DRAFT_580211 [Fennellomyces sp. T-0311]|nr:hypothetical protein BJV82DRAFT_580211 [Fennellomyces sp. T-0311]
MTLAEHVTNAICVHACVTITISILLLPYLYEFTQVAPPSSSYNAWPGRQMTTILIPNLPQELVDRIAQWLTQQDRHACILVCKQWYRVFLPNLYRCVQVKSRQALQSFFYTVQRSSCASPEYSLGKLVRDLTLGHGSKPLLPYRAADLRDKSYRIGLSRQRWAILPKLCPHVEALDFHWTTWIEIEESSSDVLFQWRSLRQIAPFHRYDILSSFLDSYGPRITSLELTRAVVEQITDWDSLLSRAPSLLNLTLTCAIDFGSLMVGSLTICLDDLIPACPPRLQSLSLTMFNLTMRQQDCPPHIHNLLTTLDLHMTEFRTPAAIAYIGQSFPRLQSLSIGRGVCNTLEQEHVRALAALLRHSRYLRYLSMSPLWDMRLLSAIRHSSLLEFRTGSLNGQIERQVGTRISRDSFPKVLNALSPDATALEIALPSSVVYIDEWIRPLSAACPRLTTLELTGNRDASSLTPNNHHHFPLHTILDALASSLHTLVVRNATVYVPHHTRHTSNTVLKHFGIHHSIIHSDLFDHLASRCPSLTTLSVTDCHYYVSLPRVNLQLRFPHHDLHSVTLRSIGVVCGLRDQHMGMGMSLALKYKGDYYHASYHKPSFVRNLVVLDQFPPLHRDEIREYSSLEQLQKDWFAKHRAHRYAYGQNLVPDKSFGYISLKARAVRKCVFESVQLE